jgi:hypothetical protein
MMEDIRKTWGFRMTNRRESLDIHHMRLVIPALATVHALSWSYKHHVEPNVVKKFDFLQSPFRQEDMAMWETVMEGNVNQAISVLDSVLGKGNKLSKATQEFKGKVPELIKAFMGHPDIMSLFDDLHRVKQKRDTPDKRGTCIPSLKFCDEMSLTPR